MTEAERQHALTEISRHLQLEGPRNWDPLIAKLGISRPTVFKLVKEVEGIAGSDEAPGILRTAQKKIKRALQDAPGEAAKNLPAIPSPNIIAADVQGGMVNIRYMQRIDKLLEDADMVRAYAVTIDDSTGKEKIKNPVMFINAAKLQNDLLQTALRAMQEVYDINKIQDMHRVIMNVIGEADPQIQHKIIDALRELNNRYGMTVEARI